MLFHSLVAKKLLVLPKYKNLNGFPVQDVEKILLLIASCVLK